MWRYNVKHSWSDSEVEAHWDKVAHRYIAENNRVKAAHNQRFKEGIRHLGLHRGLRILNISSRDGEADDYIRQAEPETEIVNAEISSGLIAEASRLRPHINQIKINSYSALPFSDNSFDRILTLETLEHVSDPDGFLTELYRVGKSGARMVLSCPPASSEWTYRIYTSLFGGHGEGPHRFPHPEEVKYLLSNTGWKLLQHYGSVLVPVGPRILQKFGEKILNRFRGSCIENLGIRQFYICERN